MKKEKFNLDKISGKSKYNRLLTAEALNKTATGIAMLERARIEPFIIHNKIEDIQLKITKILAKLEQLECDIKGVKGKRI